MLALSSDYRSTSRCYRWRKLAVACQLSDAPSCPKLKPSKLTPKELSEMKELVTSPAFAHFSIRALSWFAKRTSSVFASATTWGRILFDPTQLGDASQCLQRGLHPWKCTQDHGDQNATPNYSRRQKPTVRPSLAD